MKTPLIIIALLLLFFSCKKEYKNPYDRECPSTIWTPKNLNAIINENGIVISWEQKETHFDGFVLEYSFDSIAWSEVSGGLIDKTSRDYTDTVTYSLPKIFYRIFARADLNASGISYSKGLKVQYIKKPECLTLPATNITSTEATLNGTVQANYLTTIVTFEYGTTTNYGSTATAIESPVNGNTDTNVSINLTGLTSGTLYHFRVKAKNSLGIAYGNDKSFIVIYTSDNCGTIIDSDGNIYNTVTIGTQCWMKENLKTTSYRNGDSIGTTYPATLYTGSESAAKYQWAYDGNESNVVTYGRLYTWFVVTDSRNVCPLGWHLPTIEEWTILTTFLGGESVAGGKLKEMGTTHWTAPNTGATNESGFTALPGGFRSFSSFESIGDGGGWWSSTVYNDIYAWHITQGYIVSYISSIQTAKHTGLSVRCLKD